MKLMKLVARWPTFCTLTQLGSIFTNLVGRMRKCVSNLALSLAYTLKGDMAHSHAIQFLFQPGLLESQSPNLFKIYKKHRFQGVLTSLSSVF